MAELDALSLAAAPLITWVKEVALLACFHGGALEEWSEIFPAATPPQPPPADADQTN